MVMVMVTMVVMITMMVMIIMVIMVTTATTVSGRPPAHVVGLHVAHDPDTRVHVHLGLYAQGLLQGEPEEEVSIGLSEE